MTKKPKINLTKENAIESSFKIIVIEDDEGLSHLIQKKLQKEGYKTEGAFTGQEALAKVSGNENEILLIDFNLPDMTGKELTNQLIQKYHKIPPIIVITGFGDEKIAVEMMKLGVWDYMVKEADFIDILPKKIKHICSDVEKNNKLEKAEEDLLRILEVLNDTGEMARVGGWEVDLNTNNVFWTQSTKKIHEVEQNYIPTLEEAINFYPPESRPIIKSAISKAITKGIAWDIKIPIITAKGNRIWTNSIGKPEMQDGKCIRLRGTFQDITERKNAHDKLESNQAALKQTQKIARLGSWDWDIASDTVTWSDELFQIFKINSENGAVSYADHPKVYTPESMRDLDTAVQHTIETGAPYEIDLEIIRGDGTNAFCTARGLAKKDDKGKVIQLFGSFQDITERKQIEEELLRNQKRYQKAQAIGNVGNWEYDLKTTIFWGSDETRKIFGFKPEIKELNTDRVENCFVERTRVHQTLIDLIEHNKKYNIIYDILTEDKGIRKTIHSIAEIERDAQGNPLKVTGVVNDITTQKKADDKLKALNQQLQANEQELKASNQQLSASEQQLLSANQQLQEANQQLQANEQQLRAANQQLQASEQQLKAANQQLQASEQQLKAANQQLMTSEKQYRNLFNSLQEGVYLHRMVYDNQGNACNYRIIEANPMSEKVLRIKREDAIGKLATDLYATEKAPFIEMYAKVAETGEPVSFDQYFDPMNKHFLISVFSPQKGEFATAFIDITEGKTAEQQLKVSEEKYKALYQNAPLAYQSLNINGEIKDINPQWLKTLQYTREEVIGQWFGNFLTPDYREHFRKNFKRFKKRGTVSGVEFKMVRGDETEITVSFEGCIGYDDKGNFKQTYCTFKDITEQKKAELELINAKEKAEEKAIELKKQQALFETMFNTIKEGVVITNTNREILLANNGVLTTFGLKPKEIIGKQTKVFYADDNKFEDSGNKVFNKDADNKSNQYLTYYKHKDNTIFLGETFGSKLFDHNGNWIGNIGIIRDVSEREEFITKLKIAKEKAEEADRLKSAFLANMSHEIRTPMNGILGFTNLLLEPNLIGEEQQKFIGIIQKSGDRMLNTVNDIIDISRIETGQMELSVYEIDVCEKIESQYNFFKAEATKKGLNLLLKNSLSDSEKLLRTDKQKFNSILTNLIKNAIKHTDKGSIEIGFCRIKNEFKCYVKDTGIGIPASRQEAIFDRFVQADISDTHALEGSGLGLAITKAYVEMMGGKIWVESEVGEGSTFYFTLPWQKTKTEIEKKQSLSESTKLNMFEKKLKIMIAEDDLTSYEHLAILLDKFAKEILHVTTGTEAVKTCKGNPDIDVILMDIKMPKLNGYEATRKIREFNKDVIIVAQTAYALVDDRDSSIKAGCNDYIVKPIVKDKLLKVISTWCDKSN